MSTIYKIQLRRGLASDWLSVNPILGQGEPGIETDTGLMKLGDGVKAWSFLPYFGGSGTGDGLPPGGVFGDILTTGTAGPEWTLAGVVPGATYVLGIGTTADGNVTLSGPTTLDGAPIDAGDTVLLTAQDNSFENGLWVCQTGAWTRMPGFDVDGGIRVGQVVAVEGGENFYKSIWVCNYINDDVWTMAWETYSYWEPFGGSGTGSGGELYVQPEAPAGETPEPVLLWVDTDEDAGGAGVGLQPRATASATTASLASGASSSGTIALANSYRLLSIATDAPARVRLYTTPGKRDADAARIIGVDPTGDHGLQLEFVTAAGFLTADLSPSVDGFDGKSTPDGLIPISITNTGTGSAAITVLLSWIRTE